MKHQVDLSLIAIDAGTQVRAALNESVVAEYAERMTEGAEFPPIVLFHDGNSYYLADGFHRFMASKRVGFNTIPSVVNAGTKRDALWFALGANKANGHQMTVQDKRHAILLALQAWPERSANQIGDQVGCSHVYVMKIKGENEVVTSYNLPERVTGKDGKSYPATYTKREKSGTAVTPREARRLERVAAVKALLEAGKKNSDIAQELGLSSTRVSEIRVEVGYGTGTSKTKEAVAARRDKMREMAAEGYTSRQIASTVGMNLEGCRSVLRKEGIDVPADRTVGSAKRHDSTRIIEHIVMDAENLTADVGLIDLNDIDAARLPEWINSLKESRDKLMGFIRALMKEQQKHGQAA